MRQQGNVHSRLHPPSHNLPPFTSPPLHLAVRRFPHTKPPPSYRLLPPPPEPSLPGCAQTLEARAHDPGRGRGWVAPHIMGVQPQEVAQACTVNQCSGDQQCASICCPLASCNPS